MSDWKVNLPYFSIEPPLDGDVEPVIFAINSRITAIISDFFDLIERCERHVDPNPSLPAASLCRKAWRLYEEWQIVSVP